MIISPMRPIAWASEDIIEMAPMSWRRSSAAMVDGRIRESAKAMSAGISGLRWWHTIIMSTCSLTVFTVKGRVGLVEAGRTFGSLTSSIMSGRVTAAGALDVEDVDGAAFFAVNFPLLLASPWCVLSRNPDSFSESACRASWTLRSSQTVQRLVDHRGRGAPVLVNLEAA